MHPRAQLHPFLTKYPGGTLCYGDYIIDNVGKKFDEEIFFDFLEAEINVLAEDNTIYSIIPPDFDNPHTVILNLKGGAGWRSITTK